MPDDPRDIWNQLAPFWNEQIGEGNDFQKQLVMPATERLLQPRAGERILDACCGNGNYSRRLGRAGCNVVAFDGAAAFVDIAWARTSKADGQITFAVADACDFQAVLDVGQDQPFEAAVCSFALMDLPTIEPLLRAVRQMLTPGGRFVWSMGHPVFHTNEAIKIARQDDGEGIPAQTFGMEVTRYATDWPHLSRGILGQPQPHWIYHRSISTLLNSCFACGFTLDGIEEPTFEPDTRARSPFSWARRPEIPPAFVVRLRPTAG